MKVIEEESRLGETFLGTSGVVMPRGLTPSNKKQAQRSTDSSTQEPSTKTISQVTEEALQRVGWTDESHLPTGDDLDKLDKEKEEK